MPPHRPERPADGRAAGLGPGINDPIMLRDSVDREYRSRVEGVEPGVLTVARPLDLPADHDLVPGADLLVTWSCARGIAVLPVRLAGAHTENALPLWSMAVTGTGWVEQRRRYVRVPASSRVTLLPGGEVPAGEASVGHLVDLSEGALRCTVDAAVADGLANDDEVTAAFRFGEGDFAIAARIGFRRQGARPREQAELVVVFDEPVHEGDALRRQIFAQQVRALRTDTEDRAAATPR